MVKQYNSFAEIDERLRILKLQREIYKESVKLRIHRVRTSLYPTQIMGGFSGIVQKLVLTFALRKLSRLFRKDKQIQELLE